MRVLLSLSAFFAAVIACLWLNPPPREALLPLFWITETGTFPYVLLSLGAFTALALACTPRRRWLPLLLLIFVSMAATQGVKTVLKNLLAQPRPYVLEIAPGSASDFYALSRAERAQFVAQAYAGADLPDYLLRHRMHETGYSTPSGHGIFAISIAFLASMIFGWQGWRRGLMLALTLWAALMLYSRVVLGMHTPWDLLLSLLLATPLHLYLERRWRSAS